MCFKDFSLKISIFKPNVCFAKSTTYLVRHNLSSPSTYGIPVKGKQRLSKARCGCVNACTWSAAKAGTYAYMGTPCHMSPDPLRSLPDGGGRIEGGGGAKECKERKGVGESENFSRPSSSSSSTHRLLFSSRLRSSFLDPPCLPQFPTLRHAAGLKKEKSTCALPCLHHQEVFSVTGEKKSQTHIRSIKKTYSRICSLAFYLHTLVWAQHYTMYYTTAYFRIKCCRSTFWYSFFFNKTPNPTFCALKTECVSSTEKAGSLHWAASEKRRQDSPSITIELNLCSPHPLLPFHCGSVVFALSLSTPLRLRLPFPLQQATNRHWQSWDEGKVTRERRGRIPNVQQ